MTVKIFEGMSGSIGSSQGSHFNPTPNNGTAQDQHPHGSSASQIIQLNSTAPAKENYYPITRLSDDADVVQ